MQDKSKASGCIAKNKADRASQLYFVLGFRVKIGI